MVGAVLVAGLGPSWIWSFELMLSIFVSSGRDAAAAAAGPVENLRGSCAAHVPLNLLVPGVEIHGRWMAALGGVLGDPGAGLCGMGWERCGESTSGRGAIAMRSEVPMSVVFPAAALTVAGGLAAGC